MKDCRINIQPYIIDKIIAALETCATGIGIAEKYSYKIQNNTIIFTPKDGKEMNANDFFMLGYFVGRDY